MVSHSVISIPDRVVVFDYGEVISLSRTEADRRILEELTVGDPTLLWPRYREADAAA